MLDSDWWKAGVAAAAAVLTAGGSAFAATVVAKRKQPSELLTAAAAEKTAEALMQQALQTGFGQLVGDMRHEVDELRGQLRTAEARQAVLTKHVSAMEGVLRFNGLSDQIPPLVFP